MDSHPALAPILSVVAPCYNEEACLPEFARRMMAACQTAAGDAYEIILVDDGSRDGTWAAIEALAANDPHILGLRMLRNHGHQLAASAGLSVTRGERVLLIDADLQDPPELLPAMMTTMDEATADVVYGQRETRLGESRFKTLSAALFYRLLNALSEVPVPCDTGDFRLMTRRIVDILELMPERHRFLRGMVSWIGGTQIALPYERQPRYAGVTGYPLRRMLRFAMDAITSFSIVPLRLAVWIGAATSALAFLVLLYALYSKITGQVVPGWTSAVVTNAFFSGVQLLVLGILGEYLGRAVEQQKGRPLFLIHAMHRQGQSCIVPAAFAHGTPEERQAMLRALLSPGR